MRKFILAAALVAFSAPAFASSCPMHMKKIDEALANNPNVSSEQLSEAKKLRAEGEEFHKAGQHAESMAALAKAEEILKIE